MGVWLIETEQLYSMPDISSIPPNSTVQDGKLSLHYLLLN
jgi:hypothetical protein